MRAHRHERKAAPQPRQIVATQIDPFCAAGSAAPGRACGLRRRLAPRRRACLSYPRGILAGVSDADSDAHGSTGCPDVRQHLAELLASGEPSLDEVDWGRFRHAHGAAGDVPDLLRGLSARDQERASASLSTLWDCVCHQGGSSAPAALAVPFLLRAAADPAVHNRAQLLLLAAEAGHRNHSGRGRREDLLQAGYLPEEEAYDPSGYPAQWTLQAARDALTAGRRPHCWTCLPRWPEHRRHNGCGTCRGPMASAITAAWRRGWCRSSATPRRCRPGWRRA